VSYKIQIKVSFIDTYTSLHSTNFFRPDKSYVDKILSVFNKSIFIAFLLHIL